MTELRSFFNHPDVPGIEKKTSYNVYHLSTEFSIIEETSELLNVTVLEIGSRLGYNFLTHYSNSKHFFILEFNDIYYQVLFQFLKMKTHENVTLFHSVGYISQFVSYFDTIFISSLRYIKDEMYFKEMKNLFSFARCRKLYIIKSEETLFHKAQLLAEMAQCDFVENEFIKGFWVFKSLVDE
jgi:hypothetical protein